MVRKHQPITDFVTSNQSRTRASQTGFFKTDYVQDKDVDCTIARMCWLLICA